MASRYEEYKGLWRASANEAVPYTEDFPEAILVTPELIDGSTSAQGNATEVLLRYEWLNETQVKLILRDNGRGIANERRLLTWAAAASTNLVHQNGHGLKKALTKYHQDFDTSQWRILYRRRNQNVQCIQGPFLGIDTKSEEIETDTTSLLPSGTQIEVVFDAKVLKSKYQNPVNLLYGLRELICTRYSEVKLQKTRFTLEVKKGAFEKSICSFNAAGELVWHSFETCLQKMVDEKKGAVCVSRGEEAIPGGKWTYVVYYLTMGGNTSYELKNAEMFPVYGRKGIPTSRIFLALDGRTIEPYAVYRILNKESPHNDHNGIVGFVNFVPDAEDPEAFKKMPIPATTKVSFYENCPRLLEFREKFHEILEKKVLPAVDKVRNEKPSKPAAAPKPTPKPAPKPVPKIVLPKPKPKPVTPSPEPATESESESESEESVSSASTGSSDQNTIMDQIQKMYEDQKKKEEPVASKPQPVPMAVSTREKLHVLLDLLNETEIERLFAYASATYGKE